MPRKTKTGFKYICFWTFPSPLWAQPNCCKYLQFWYNKYSIKLELVLEYYHVFHSFPVSLEVSLEQNQRPTVFKVDRPSVSRTPVNKIWLHQRSLKLCTHILLRLSPSCRSSLILSGIRSSDITLGWQRQRDPEGVLIPKHKLNGGVLTSVRTCRVDSLGCKHCKASSVHFKVFLLRCSTNEDCCCWRILNRSLIGRVNKKIVIIRNKINKG